ncbi:MAG: NADH:flavin oxidoreductase [Oscillospiraceae bacterium]|nr:NADH:flavin oxidoreductase [Oscillospiraceae bacterium]
MLYEPIRIGRIELKNRLVMPPMQSNTSRRGHVTDALLQHYRERALHAAPGLIVTEHCCVTEAGRADKGQLSIAEDALIEEHRLLTETVHEAGSRIIAQLNHGGSGAEPFDGGELVSASAVPNLRKKLGRTPRPLTVEEILALEERYAEAAVRAVKAGYDGVEIHCAHGYLLNQFYSPLTNRRDDAYGSASVMDRCRFLLETMAKVRAAIGEEPVMAVRLGGADYMPGGSTEEDAAAAARLIEAAGADLLDVSGGMCGYVVRDRGGAGYFGTMTEKIKAAVALPVVLTGGVTTPAEAERLLADGKADLIGVGRALLKDAHWGEAERA